MEKKFSRFVTIWAGQFFSILGSGISAFGLSVWIFQKTGSATPFAMSFLCNILPGIIFAPLAGTFADRKKRKNVMIVSDTLDAILKIGMAALLFTGLMKVWMVFPILFLSSTFSTFQGPCYNASIPMLVEEKHLSRANGLVQFSQAAQNMLAPVLAGVLYPILELKGLLIIDFLTYFIGVLCVIVIKIPQQEIAEETVNASLVFKDLKTSFKLVTEREGFLGIIIVFSILNFVANMAMILIGPMVLSTYSASIYGTIETIYAVSMLIGGFMSGILPNPKKPIFIMFVVLILSGLGLIVTGGNTFWIVIAAGMFIFFFFVPYANTLFQTLVQTLFDKTSLGRVGSLLNAMLKLVSPLAGLIAGPLVDYCLDPMMKTGGILDGTIITSIIGSGEGRGCGLLFIICGLILSLICIIMAIKYRNYQPKITSENVNYIGN